MGVLLDIKERMSIFKNFYDEIRVVDPINNKVFSDEFNSKINDNLNKKECSTSNCYDVWGKNQCAVLVYQKKLI